MNVLKCSIDRKYNIRYLLGEQSANIVFRIAIDTLEDDLSMNHIFYECCLISE